MEINKNTWKILDNFTLKINKCHKKRIINEHDFTIFIELNELLEYWQETIKKLKELK